MLDRRAFLYGTISAALAMPVAADAQQAAKVYRIGWFVPKSPIYATVREAFLTELRQLGQAHGHAITVEDRGPGPEFQNLDALPAELVALKPDVILAAPTALARAVRRATTIIPIVFAIVSDPIGDGLVESFARPGGNATGMANVMLDFAPKTLELLTEAVPGIRRVSYLWSPVHGEVAVRVLEGIREAAKARGLAFHSIPVRTTQDLEPAFRALLNAQSEAFVVLADPLLMGPTNRARIAEFARRNRLPAAVAGLAGDWAKAGGLMGYEPNYIEMFRRAGGMVDKILRGTAPAALPVERPVKFELVINLKTARALGLTIPPSLLLRADQVIE